MSAPAAAANDDDSASSSTEFEDIGSKLVLEDTDTCIVVFGKASQGLAFLKKLAVAVAESNCRVKVLLPNYQRVMLCGDRSDIMAVLGDVEHEKVVFQTRQQAAIDENDNKLNDDNDN